MTRLFKPPSTPNQLYLPETQTDLKITKSSEAILAWWKIEIPSENSNLT